MIKKWYFWGFMIALISCSQLLAETTEGATATKLGVIDDFFAYFLAVGIAAVGGAIGQSNVIARTIEGTARNPSVGDKLFTTMILGLALIESLFIFTFVSIFMLK